MKKNCKNCKLFHNNKCLSVIAYEGYKFPTKTDCKVFEPMTPLEKLVERLK